VKLIPISVQADSAEADLVMYRKAMPEMVKRGQTSQRFADLKIATQEAIVATLRMMLPPKGVEQGTLPVVLHFGTDKDRDEFLHQVGLVKKG
jgi:hypothetical protein